MFLNLLDEMHETFVTSIKFQKQKVESGGNAGVSWREVRSIAIAYACVSPNVLWNWPVQCTESFKHWLLQLIMGGVPASDWPSALMPSHSIYFSLDPVSPILTSRCGIPHCFNSSFPCSMERVLGSIVDGAGQGHLPPWGNRNGSHWILMPWISTSF